MVSSMKRISVSFLVGFALFFTVPKVDGQRHSMPARRPMTPQQFHFNRAGINRSRFFFTPTPFGFDPFLRERIRSDPFLRERIRSDPFLRREFAFDRLSWRRFHFDPFLGSGVFGFPAFAVTPFFFGGLNGF